MRISVRDHCFLHWVRWKTYGKPQDGQAYAWRKGDTNEIVRMRLLTIVAFNRKHKLGWFDSQIQSELGKIGGKKGGKANSELQKSHRRELGLRYGQLSGIKNQSPFLKVVLENQLSFYHVSGLNVIFGKSKSITEIGKVLQTLNTEPTILNFTSLRRLIVPRVYPKYRKLSNSAESWSLISIIDKRDVGYLNLCDGQVEVREVKPNETFHYPILSFDTALICVENLVQEGMQLDKRLSTCDNCMWLDVINLFKIQTGDL